MISHFRLAALAALLALTGPVSAQFSACPQFFPGAAPKVPADRADQARELCFDAFAVLHSGRSKTPVFVAEKLTREQLTDALDEVRTNRFYPEARLPSASRAQLDDYKDSGYDRGHMAPAADMPNAQAMAQSFSLSNMVPQAPINNRKTWAKIEKDTRKYATRAEGPVYVFSGPVFSEPVEKIGLGKVWVPTYLFKLVYDKEKGKAWAHWVENTDEARATRPISYQELVSRTGIEFLAGVAIED